MKVTTVRSTHIPWPQGTKQKGWNVLKPRGLEEMP
jgi:hypothetical protein